jgi:hypothetical protein
MGFGKIGKISVRILLTLFLGAYLLLPVRVCGMNCPSCLASAKTLPAQSEETAVPICHQAQAPSCHKSEAAENQCQSKSEKPHQCCMKSAASLATTQKIATISHQAEAGKLEILSTSLDAFNSPEQSFSLKQALDTHHHKLKASNKLFLINSSLLI